MHLRHRSTFSRRRPTVQWVVARLTEWGLPISPGRVRAYLPLLQPAPVMVQTGHQFERRFTEADLQRLETVVILKSLGFTNPQVRAWQDAPDLRPIQQRVVELQYLIQRAQHLLRTHGREATQN